MNSPPTAVVSSSHSLSRGACHYLVSQSVPTNTQFNGNIRLKTNWGCNYSTKQEQLYVIWFKIKATINENVLHWQNSFKRPVRALSFFFFFKLYLRLFILSYVVIKCFVWLKSVALLWTNGLVFIYCFVFSLWSTFYYA